MTRLRRHLPTALLLATALLLTSRSPGIAAPTDQPIAAEINELVQDKDGMGLVKMAKKLRSGSAVSSANPLRIPDYIAARQVLENTVSLTGAIPVEAKVMLAKMLLVGEGGPIDTKRALVLLDEATKVGDASAAYLKGQQLAAVAGKAQEAREALNLAFRLGDASAAFALAKLPATGAEQARAMNTFGLNVLLQRAAQGDADAAFELGAYYRSLPPKPEDQRSALDWYRKAAELGSDRAPVWVARLLAVPQSSVFDRQAALAQYEAAANAGSLEAAQEMVRDYTDAGALDVPAPTYEQWITKLLEAKDATAVLYRLEGAGESFEQRKRASDELYAAAVGGAIVDVDDLIRVGDSFQDGSGVLTDRRRALDIFRLGIERGSNAALTRFVKALIGSPSLRTADNYALASEKLILMAQNQSATADLLLGDLAAKGVGGTVDEEKAASYYKHALSVSQSAEVLERVAGVYLASPDADRRKQAFPYLLRASELGSKNALLRLARAYADGDLVAVNVQKAIPLYRQALAAGATDALGELANLYVSQDPKDGLANARKLFAETVAAGNKEAVLAMARFLKANGKMDEAIGSLTVAARKDDSQAAVELYRFLAERAHDANVSKEWLEQALSHAGQHPQDKIGLASAMLETADLKLNLRGVSILRELVDIDIPGASVALSAAYIERKGSLTDAATGVELLRQAASRGDIDASLKLGDLYMEGKFVEQDQEKAVSYYQQALADEPDNRAANVRLADAYRTGRGVERNLAKSAAHLTISAEAGSRMATRDLGLAYLEGSGVARDDDRAIRLLSAAGERGFVFAWQDLSQAYSSAIGPDVDSAKSFRFAMRGARNGDVSSMISTGTALLSGYGTVRDSEAGILWLERAASTAGPEASVAMMRLADTYRYGAGVPKDIAKAQAWQLKAAQAGSGSAMFHMALDRQAEATPEGHAAAVEWLRSATAQRHVQSRKLLGKMGLGADFPSSASHEKVEDDGVEE
ncbi:hypothetical protein ASE04_11650 [Rhizobium sp. Root708]|uniref:SEL1-like repeat protein n=1 Tax=Rhizobium sp. Root708 TaxID=1736592 RepID=UPI0006F4EE10|nr:SEL1-like repeat protein [Rhizobium sp. Root708]KRB51530.1 hypothetical protein ASE04_11650 [Rhizobium sp. Root708]